MVNNHGDRKSPKDRVGLDPFQMGELHGLEMGVILTTESSPGMILQVGKPHFRHLAPEKFPKPNRKGKRLPVPSFFRGFHSPFNFHRCKQYKTMETQRGDPSKGDGFNHPFGFDMKRCRSHRISPRFWGRRKNSPKTSFKINKYSEGALLVVNVI